MSMQEHGQAGKTEALKGLRMARRETIAAAAARVKAQKKEITAIKDTLEHGGKTVPEIALATGIASDIVMWYLATLKKYGEISEGAQDGSYFRYQLAKNAEEQ